MRLAAIASTLAIVLCVAVFGAIFWQKSSSVTAAVPAQAAAPTEGYGRLMAPAGIEVCPLEALRPVDWEQSRRQRARRSVNRTWI